MTTPTITQYADGLAAIARIATARPQRPLVARITAWLRILMRPSVLRPSVPLDRHEHIARFPDGLTIHSNLTTRRPLP